MLEDKINDFFYFLQQTGMGCALIRFYQARIKCYFPKFRRRVTIMIALTYECQCKCPHCGVATYGDSTRSLLKEEEVFNLIDGAKKIKADRIYFSGGEPLLVKRIFGYIKYAKQFGLKTELDTNGLMLDDKIAGELKHAGLDIIRISIDSADESRHDRLRGVKGLYKKAVNGAEFCKMHKLRCIFSTYATKENLSNGDLLSIIKLADKAGVELRILSSICSGKLKNNKSVALGRNDILKLRGYLKRKKVYWETGGVSGKCSPFYCPSIEKGLIYISAYGDVFPCCYMPVKFGNIREESLKKIIPKMWESEIFYNYTNEPDCVVNNPEFRERYLSGDKKYDF